MPALAPIRPLIGLAVRVPARLLRRHLAAQAQARSRRSLGRIDDHILRDIGLTRHEAEAEAARPAWNVPLHWRG